MKKVLMIAFHYPPFRGSSGIQRTLKFSRYLGQLGWQPVVLSASPRAYSQVGDDQIYEIPKNVPVMRAFALDAALHLSIGGSYSRWLAQPDRWVTWLLGAVPAGLYLVGKYRPAALWSTYPIATAHLIGLALHRLTGLPWIADFRDSMLEDKYPSDVLTRRSYRWLEMKVIKSCSRVIFTTESARRMYLNRYSGLPPERCLVISNGYDEEDFKQIRLSKQPRHPCDRPMRLLHAGVIYPDDRDPRAFFRALARLKKEDRIDRRSLRVELRASGSDADYLAIIRELGIDDLVSLLPPLPYREALQDCADADGLIILQAASCNHLIPAKAYEYLRLRKPILGLSPHDGETAALLRQSGGSTIVDLGDEAAIYAALPHFLNRIRNGRHALPDAGRVEGYGRRNQAIELAKCLDGLMAAGGGR